VTGPPPTDRWERLDEALARLRACRSAAELARCAAPLAVAGCGVRTAEVRLGEAPPGEGASDETSASRAPQIWSCTGSLDAAFDVRPLVAAGRRVGELRVDSGYGEADVLAAFCAALASMLALVHAWEWAEELDRALAQLAHGVSGYVESPLELAGPLPARPDPAPVHDRLTGRQREVLGLLLAGLSNAEIAERLVVSVPTVKSHVRAILRASGAVNRADAMARLNHAATRPRYNAVL
jgi:ATP/maltotriose-dependent transcriptional regulator MalT